MDNDHVDHNEIEVVEALLLTMAQHLCLGHAVSKVEEQNCVKALIWVRILSLGAQSCAIVIVLYLFSL
ncbi:uncharacterized protein P174DRAFT_262504 [Aspergillus novofumigatus IBT 16806]|uniref:Uncharacterized protein n=1 Tax=Aspergillus novofumigatus (strain IBT 16806) TaxID=1392255 RepID=A0A2I1C3G4_ASPN1|nr:uncharacterized protein P174DRAFT_262504 [Aspergillus novofumigatus IBT 16806]PKX92172.1 hypothetical protein P174DRAFT_262504 [Aspergillus novofumigatus IBT 16806]